MVYTDRLLPHSVEAEESVIGALLIDNEAFPKITGIVTAEDFYVTKNRWCFEACLALFDRSEAINQVTVAEELVLRERLEEIGGTSYLAHLVRTVPTTIHVEHYAGIVQRTSIMRRLIRTADEIAAIGYEGDADADAALSKAEDMLYRVRTARSTRDFMFTFAKSLTNTWRRRHPCRPATTSTLHPSPRDSPILDEAARRRTPALRPRLSSPRRPKSWQEHARLQHRPPRRRATGESRRLQPWR